ncbi:MAG: tyrosine-type recombinase/integrase [Defluviitaleaceae bacterium]|nr:tyrosine-type recombinase/integrase [Defluviitaleaceae bacterium]
MSQYYSEQEAKNKKRLDELRKELPPFLSRFFANRADHTSSRTRVAYAYDLRLFFNFLTNETREFGDLTAHTFDLEHFAKITDYHIEDFLDYLGFYQSDRYKDNAQFNAENKASGKARKLSTLRAVFAYFYKKGHISGNPAELVDMPPVKEKAKVYLDVDEIANLLDVAENGADLTGRQKEYHAHTRCRDVALLSMLSGTGIRVSELVGLNVDDVNVDRGSFRVIRKGGDEAILFFNEEVEMALRDYLEVRNLKKGKIQEGHENALFLSLQNRRITARAVQNLVKKYSNLAVDFKKITPHKLRTSFGTNMYRQTGDIYLVADLLGHKDVNTTRKSYADTKEEAGRRAVRNLRLRRDD